MGSASSTVCGFYRGPTYEMLPPDRLPPPVPVQTFNFEATIPKKAKPGDKFPWAVDGKCIVLTVPEGAKPETQRGFSYMLPDYEAMVLSELVPSGFKVAKQLPPFWMDIFIGEAYSDFPHPYVDLSKGDNRKKAHADAQNTLLEIAAAFGCNAILVPKITLDKHVEQHKGVEMAVQISGTPCVLVPSDVDMPNTPKVITGCPQPAMPAEDLARLAPWKGLSQYLSSASQ